jgi:ubiquitin C-terminal hydrolase
LESLLSLLKKFQIDTKEEGNDYDMYFALLSHLIHRVFSNNSHTKLNLQEVFDHLSKQIINRGCHESSNSDKVDRFFSGICKLLSEIYPYIEPSNISDELFRKLCSDYLFISSLEDVKRNLPCCKSFASRRAAICLLVSMVSGSHVLSMNRRSALFELIFKHIKGLPQKYFQGNTPDFHRRSPLGFAGLKNQGNTCYLNSCIQQFFMMPKFRRSILNAPIDIKSVNLDDDMVHQLQVMFGFLCLTQKQAFDTISFCKTYKDEQGNPVDVRIQQDAQEFLNVFCDRIETKMKALGNADILNNFLKGKLINQMICLGGCGSIREKEEDFFSLSLQVNQKSDLEESLKSFVNPELVNGVSCEACGKKSDTHMRAVVGKLPETIIFHLKRFQLNFETFMNEKINDRFEFPMEINLEPFTKAGLARKEAFLKQQQKTTTETNQEDSKGENTSKDEHLNDKANENVENKDEEYSPDENCKYRLSGIVVHIGNAQAGHYYSFIRVRGSETWLEFNDNIVRKFDLKILSEEAFGGKLESDGKNWEMMLDNENIKNAYLLIYEKMNSESSPDALEKSNASSIESSTVETTISELIDLDNLQFLKESHIYSEDYFNLVLDLLKMNDVMSNNPMEATYLSFGIKFAFHIVARSIDCSMLAKFFDLFSYWFERKKSNLFLSDF